MQKPSTRRLDVLRWVVAGILAVTYILTGFEPVFYAGLAVLLLPLLLRRKHYGPDEPATREHPAKQE
ncbi:hypothetical protein [Aeromicrobium sp. NPDC092404]|uniref:hypothetical protein n=1 Tax=Aeromicrobium sp. NPDC092404 TaxID=3154976 RepID=UPI003429BA95